METKKAQLLASLSEKTPKQMRTLRNNLNNRLKSFEDEVTFGKSLPKLSESHSLYALELKDCKEILAACLKILKAK